MNKKNNGGTMQDLKEDMKAQLKELDELISKSNKNLIKLKNIPDKGITVSKSNGYDQYYWIDKTSGKRTYAKVSEMDMLKKTAQHRYEHAVAAKLNNLKNELDKFLKTYDVSEIDKVYTHMSKARQLLVSPIIDTEEIFVKKWESVTYESSGFINDSEFYSSKGIKVRSKSELIIANALEQCGVPYRYEYPLYLKGIGTVYPDFTCLNISKRKEIVWEHFGMMDNIAYSNKNIAKIQAYHQNGFFPGKNMIMTFETSQNSISSTIIQNIIKELLQ